MASVEDWWGLTHPLSRARVGSEMGKAGGLWAWAIHTRQGTPVDRALPQTSTWRPHGANQSLLASQH